MDFFFLFLTSFWLLEMFILEFYLMCVRSRVRCQRLKSVLVFCHWSDVLFVSGLKERSVTFVENKHMFINVQKSGGGSRLEMHLNELQGDVQGVSSEI